MSSPTDKQETRPCGSLTQHGPYNDRIYLMKLGENASQTLPLDLISVARNNQYTKIFAKIPQHAEHPFTTAGYVEEAQIPAFYSGKEAAIFMAFYLNEERSIEPELERINDIYKMALAKEMIHSLPPLSSQYVLRACDELDVGAMAEIYRTVFPSYPFPIHEPDYLLETMHSHVDYFGIETEGSLVAISSAERDDKASSVEMTDFATLPEWLGNRFAQYLLTRMEQEMKQKNLRTAYTIARAMSPGMNITFSKTGYHFGGRLKNNTNISGNIESMNVWHKPL